MSLRARDVGNCFDGEQNLVDLGVTEIFLTIDCLGLEATTLQCDLGTGQYLRLPLVFDVWKVPPAFQQERIPVSLVGTGSAKDSRPGSADNQLQDENKAVQGRTRLG